MYYETKLFPGVTYWLQNAFEQNRKFDNTQKWGGFALIICGIVSAAATIICALLYF